MADDDGLAIAAIVGFKSSAAFYLAFDLGAAASLAWLTKRRIVFAQ
jgi:hypothetical protein